MLNELKSSVLSILLLSGAQCVFASDALYKVIDLSGGTQASSFTVTELEAVPDGGWTDVYKTERLVLRRIDLGTFTMGSPEDEFGRQSNEFQHSVTISAVSYVSVFPVTQGQWELVMGTNPSYYRDASSYASQPANRVSYDNIRGSNAGAGWPQSSEVDADSFIGVLRAKTGIVGLDLPTDALWEYACRAGTTTSLYNGENLANRLKDENLDKIARYKYNGGDLGPAPVGSYAPNDWGLYDMLGNVHEWCLDWFVSELREDAIDPVGPKTGVYRVCRGGSWGDDANSCRSAQRGGNHDAFKPSSCNNNVGFRIAWFNHKEPEPEPPVLTTVGFSDLELTVQEGDTLEVRVNGGSPVTNTSVQVSIGLQSASLADLDLPDGMEFPFTLTWNAGEVGYKTFLLPIKSDNTLEENEQFTLRLENPDKVVLTNDSCVVTILDGVIETDLNEELPYLVIDLSGGTATESFPVAGVGAVPLSGWPEEYKTKKLVLRRIDPGTFTMGSPEEEVGRQANEFQHNVTISTVSYVSVFPVTQMQWELVMGSNPSFYMDGSNYASQPANRVSYENIRGSNAGAGWPQSSEVDADSFIGVLRTKTGLVGLDLPTDAIWEYACRAGTTTALYNGEDLVDRIKDGNLDKIARYKYNGGDLGPAAVGSYAPNDWGLYDMLGNVHEWCLDWFVSELSEDATDPVGPETGVYRVCRGGSWGDDANSCRSAQRGGNHDAFKPSSCNNNVGFRLACFIHNEPEPEPPVLTTIGFADLELAVLEGDSLAVTVSGGSLVTNTSVQISIGLQSASLADLDLPDGMEFPLTLTWNAGEVGDKTFLIPIKSDNTLEANEQFILSLINPDNVILTNDSCVVTILDGVIETDFTEELPYLVIDLSGGTTAESFPITGVDTVPPWGWSEEYKTRKLVLRRIDPGTFTMGSPDGEVGRQANEFQHNVKISAVNYVSVFPVTQGQWELVMGSNPSFYVEGSNYAAQPANSISYDDIRGSNAGAEWPASFDVDADSFIGKLRAKTGLAGLDLPTDALWEYACRAGTTTALYNGENLAERFKDENLDKIARYKYNGGDYGAAMVGSYEPNAWGLYDMLGNVHEWCLDWFVSELSEDATDPVGPETGVYRVCRGGSWKDDADACRSAQRGGNNDTFKPTSFANNVGFRLACFTSPTPAEITVGFVETELEIDEGGILEVAVSGGSPVTNTSVKVWLNYQNASAADLALQKDLKFPLTLTWAAGEVDVKTVQIPVKTDSAIEDSETFTLQLADPERILLGNDVCTVTIRDCNSAATLQDAVNGGSVKVSSSGTSKWLAVEAAKLAGTPLQVPADLLLDSRYVACSPELPVGKWCELKAAALKGPGTLAFSVAVMPLAETGGEENPQSVLALYDGKSLVTQWVNPTAWVYETVVVSDNKSHNFVWRFTQGSDTTVRGVVANVAWYPKDVEMGAVSLYAIPEQGGFVSGGGEYPMGTKVTVKATARPGWDFLGWYSAGDDALISPKASMSFSVQDHKFFDARFARQIYVRGLADAASGGKVTGSGYLAAGKRITLRASANSGFTFIGWYEYGSEEPVCTTASLVLDNSAKPASPTKTSFVVTNLTEDKTYCARFVGNPRVTVNYSADAGKVTGAGRYAVGAKVTLKASPATKPVKMAFVGWFDSEGLVSLNPNFSFTMPEDDFELEARFRPVDEVPVPTVTAPEAGAWDGYVGVEFEREIAVVSDVLPTVKVSGLPPGLKYDAAKMRLYGVPTKAGTFDVKIDSSSVAGKAASQVVRVEITALPEWANGKFDGGSDYGQLTLTVGNTGKISGKFLCEGLTWTLTAASYCSYDSVSNLYTAVVVGKSGKETFTTTVYVGGDDFGGYLDSEYFSGYQNLWKKEPWKSTAKEMAGSVLQSPVELEDGSSGDITLKAQSTGNVLVTAKFNLGVDPKTGRNVVYNASGSAVLCLSGYNSYYVFVYIPPKAGKFNGYAACFELNWGGEE